MATAVPAEPFVRYTRTPSGASGWLVKEGKTLKQQSARYFRLTGPALSNHREHSAPPTWTLSLVHAHVTPGPRRHELLIKTNGRRFSLFASNPTDFRRWLFALRVAAAPACTLDTFYSPGSVIGDGINGEVLSGRDRLTHDHVAIKSLPLRDDEDESENAVTEEEIRIAKSLNHVNLVRTYDIFRDTNTAKVHMVMEFVAGGELRDRVDTPQGTLVTERDGIRIARDLLSALVYLHDRGIVHRDIKLENVLCVQQPGVEGSGEGGLQVKLADFGSSTTLTTKRRALNSAVGTGYYLAPEIIQEQEYGRGVDLWALGVLMYISLSSQLPFVGLEVEDYFQNVIKHEVEFPEEDWKGISLDAQDFIQGLMQKKAEKRLTAREALRHAWLTNGRGVADAVTGVGMETDDRFGLEEDASADGDQVEGTRSLLFGRRRTAAEILSKKERRPR